MKISTSNKPKIHGQETVNNSSAQAQVQSIPFDFYNMMQDVSAKTAPPPELTSDVSIDAPTVATTDNSAATASLPSAAENEAKSPSQANLDNTNANSEDVAQKVAPQTTIDNSIDIEQLLQSMETNINPSAVAPQIQPQLDVDQLVNPAVLNENKDLLIQSSDLNQKIESTQVTTEMLVEQKTTSDQIQKNASEVNLSAMENKIIFENQIPKAYEQTNANKIDTKINLPPASKDQIQANIVIEKQQLTTSNIVDNEEVLLDIVEQQQQLNPQLTMKPASPEAKTPLTIQSKADTKEKAKTNIQLPNIEANNKNKISNESPDIKEINPIINSLASIQQPNISQETQPNNYLNVFMQLGQFINGHTSRNMPEMVQNKPSTFVDAQQEAVNKAIAQEQVSVEMQSPSFDALNKEAYNAKIKIYPPELGPVLANLKMDKNNVELVIQTHSIQVKEIIESNLPQLREQFQKADINLTAIHVQTESNNQAGAQNNNNRNNSESSQDEKARFEAQEQSTSHDNGSKKSQNKLVDTYA